MKKYIYSAVFISVVAAMAIFFFRPPEINPPAASTTLELLFRFPEGYEFTEGAPFALTWRVESPKGMLSDPVADKRFNPLIAPYRFAFSPGPGAKAVLLNARLYYCHKTSRMCFQDDFQKRVSLTPEAGSVIPVVWDVTSTKTVEIGTRT